MPRVASTCVRSAGPPPVSRYPLLKSPSVQIIERIVEVRYSVCSAGQVMKRNFCQPEAPSTDAASYCSAGIASRPATRINVQNGNDFQMCTMIASESARIGSFNQFGPSACVRRKMTELMSPHSGFSMKRNDRMVGIDGTAHGRMKRSESHLIHVRVCTKKPDRKSAISIFRLIPTMRKASVFSAERENTGASKSFT